MFNDTINIEVASGGRVHYSLKKVLRRIFNKRLCFLLRLFAYIRHSV